eukprot:CCRYP_002169-RA/>CCRYP_002169-RA protein AED:0.46 eAED:0.79 QI:0/0/0/1/0/0/2/0/81
MFPWSSRTQQDRPLCSQLSNPQAFYQTCCCGKKQHQPQHPRNLITFSQTLTPGFTGQFTDFPHSLMSVGKTADDKPVSIFT